MTKTEKVRRLPLPIKKIKEIILFLFKELDYKIKDTAELSIVLCDNSLIQELNAEFLNKNIPTDVLVFNLEDNYSPLLGEIVISLEEAIKQAKEYKISARLEFINLLTHAVLHLAGYDHKEYSLRDKMFRKQEELTRCVIKSIFHKSNFTHHEQKKH